MIRVPIGHDGGLRPLVPGDVRRYRTLMIYLRPSRELAGLALLHTTRLNGERHVRPVALRMLPHGLEAVETGGLVRLALRQPLAFHGLVIRYFDNLDVELFLARVLCIQPSSITLPTPGLWSIIVADKISLIPQGRLHVAAALG